MYYKILQPTEKSAAKCFDMSYCTREAYVYKYQEQFQDCGLKNIHV
jgi:hypothetical protein